MTGRALAAVIVAGTLAAAATGIAASWRLRRESVRVELDASRRWVTLGNVHPAFAWAIRSERATRDAMAQAAMADRPRDAWPPRRGGSRGWSWHPCPVPARTLAPTRDLVLASASPARLAVLRAAGFAPRVVVSGVAEDGVDGLDARTTAGTLAQRKAAAVAQHLTSDEAGAPDGQAGPAPLVVGCDSVLAFAGEVRGKPGSPEQAVAWWRGYRGRSGTLVTGHAVVDVASGRQASAVAETVVRFGRPTDAEIDAYVATGEPLGVAGGFTLDGYGAPFVAGIDGDHGTVLGLSLATLRGLLAGLDVDVTSLWAR
jgi:septum formation protein